MRKRFWKGLRTIELVSIVSVIFIILGVVAVRYPHFKCRAMQSEAKFALEEIYAAQKYFHAEHDRYATLDELIYRDGRIRLMQKYYIFNDLVAPDKDSFSIIASGAVGTLVAGEQWMINELQEVRLAKAMCKE